MSLLMVHHEPEGVIIVTDTLATTVQGESHLLVTKCGIVPHLNLVIAGTGIAHLSAVWWGLVMEAVLCRDVDMLNLHAPDALRAEWSKIEAHLPDGTETATIYHFGLSEERNIYVGYAYRSKNDFESEELEPAFRVKPEPRNGLDDVPESLEGMVALALQIKQEQDERTASDRIYIGGELVLTVLQNGAINATKLYRWPDFEETWQTMNDRLHQQNGTLAEPL
jgi:hypothetical protein